LAKESGLENKVVITGAFNEGDKIKIYSSFDVFVFPSYAEGFGISLIEAMYLNIPVICSDLEVLKEVGGPAIKYFNTGSSEDLTEKMRRVYEEISSGKDLGLDKARLKVQSEYTMEGFIGNYLALYRSLL
jgi:glycosyltransferase involved in cell wall biosynthesis